MQILHLEPEIWTPGRSVLEVPVLGSRPPTAKASYPRQNKNLSKLQHNITVSAYCSEVYGAATASRQRGFLWQRAVAVRLLAGAVEQTSPYN